MAANICAVSKFDGADEGERNADLQAGEHARQGAGRPDLPQDLEGRAAQGPGEVEHRRLDRAQALHRVDDDRKDRDESGDGNLGLEPCAEPDHEQRCDRDLGHRVHRHQKRIERVFEHP